MPTILGGMTSMPSESASAVGWDATGPGPSRPVTAAGEALPVGFGRAAGAVALVVPAVAGTAIWVATGGGYFWPRWLWFVSVLALVSQLAAEWVRRRRPGYRRQLAAHGAVAVLLSAVEVAVWALTGGGFFWPVFPMCGVSMTFAVHLWSLTWVIRPSAD
jgi:hypothetical protein